VFKFGNTPPMVAAPTLEQQAALAAMEDRIAAAERDLEQARRLHGDKPLPFPPGADWYPELDLAKHVALDDGAEGVIGSARAFDGKTGVEAGDSPNPNYDDR